MYRRIFILSVFLFLSSVLSAQNCHAEFSYTIDTSGTTVTFTDLSYTYDSLDYITSWSWDFGDGTAATSQNPSHTYNAQGVYVVCLTINTSLGDSDTYCDSINVTGGQNPCAGFYITGIVTNESISGANDGAIDITVSGGTAPFNFLWSDSLTTEDLSGLASGYYCVTVTDSNSCTATYCDSVIAGQNPCAGFYVSGIVTNESISGANDGAIDIIVSGGTTPFNFLWSDSSTTEDLSGLASGNYCVTVTDSNSCSYDTCFIVDVDSTVFCNALFSYSSGSCPNCYEFADLSTAGGTITSWYWDFGNGNYSTLQNPQQTFLDSGIFVVSLTITTTDSCTSSYSDTIYISQSIQAFSVSGQVFADSSLLPSGTAQLYSNNFSETHPPFYSTQIQNGSYFFSQVASGNYKLLAVPDAPESDNFQSTFFGDKIIFSDAFVLSVYSNLVSVDIHLQPNSNGIADVKIDKFCIYPNPFTDFFTIESQETVQAIKIYSLTGELRLCENNLHSKNILLKPNIPKGLYLLMVQTDKSVKVLKISKN